MDLLFAAAAGSGLARAAKLLSSFAITKCCQRVNMAQDADLDLAAKNIIKGGYSYSGQRCTAVKVVLALESIADELVKKVRLQLSLCTLATPT